MLKSSFKYQNLDIMVKHELYAPRQRNILVKSLFLKNGFLLVEISSQIQTYQFQTYSVCFMFVFFLTMLSCLVFLCCPWSRWSYLRVSHFNKILEYKLWMETRVDLWATYHSDIFSEFFDLGNLPPPHDLKGHRYMKKNIFAQKVGSRLK